ncbi:hypothetical protein LSPH24S_04559 [Lysinibacillus sphaericus]
MNRVKELLLNGSSADIENYFAIANDLRNDYQLVLGQCSRRLICMSMFLTTQG